MSVRVKYSRYLNFLLISKKNNMNEKTAQWILRIAVAGEFIGHGVLALQRKKDWVGWFAKFGVTDAATAVQLLFIIGIIDIALAILVLVKPVRIAILWMVFWGFWTALLRILVNLPLEAPNYVPVWDFIERWANWGAPLALLILIGWPRNPREWFK